MNKEQKQEVIDTLKNKFSQYSNFYITDTQQLSVAQINNLRRHCFDKQVEMKVAKNTLIKKALESLDSEKYSGVYDSLHQVTALMFSESPKEPALIISSFRKQLNAEKPVLKAAFLNGDIFVGDNQLIALTKIKTKNELIGEVIGLLMSPIQRVIGALQNRPENVTSGNGKVVEPTERGAEVAEAKKATEVKAEVIGPAAERKAITTEPVADSKTETTKPGAEPGIVNTESTEAKTEVAEINTAAEVKAEVAPLSEVKAIVTEPATEEPKTEAIKPGAEGAGPEAGA